MSPTVVAPFRNSHLGRQASDSNRQLQGIAIPWDLPLPAAGDDIVAGDATANRLGQATFTVQDVDLAGPWDNSAAAGSKFTDDTTDANDTGGADVLVLPATEEDELDFFLVGQLEPFFALAFDIATAGVGGVVAPEYLNRDGVWTALTAGRYFDGTVSFTAAAGVHQFVFEPPEDWGRMGGLQGKYDLDGVIAEVEGESTVTVTPRYYLRFRVTTVYSTNPVLDEVDVYEMNAAAVIEAFQAPARGVIDALSMHAETAGGGNNDVVLLFVNHTQQKRGLFILNTAASNLERVAATRGMWVDQGDEITVHVLQEDGTTEPATITLIPEISI